MIKGKRHLTLRVLITLSILLCVTKVFANPTEQSPYNSGHFLIGVELGAFQQNNLGTTFTVVDNNPILSDPAQGDAKSVQTTFKFGWGFLIGFRTANNNDIKFYLFLHDGSNKNNVIPGSGQHVDAVLLPGDWNQEDALSANSTLKYRNNIYQLSVGHSFAFFRRTFLIHPFFGLGAAKVNLTQDTRYVGTDGTNEDAFVHEQSKFWGIGPLVGLGISWHLCKGLKLIGSISWNPLISDLKNKYRAEGVDAPTESLSFINGSSVKDIINQAIGEIGIAYDIFIRQRHSLEILLGYRTVTYIGGSRSSSPAGDNNEALLISSSETAGFQGVFIRLSAAI